MARQVLIITGDGGESYETWFAVHRFQEAGYITHVAAPSKRRLHLAGTPTGKRPGTRWTPTSPLPT
jgi:hypothetical protein